MTLIICGHLTTHVQNFKKLKIILYGGKLKAIYRRANPLMANFNLLVYTEKVANFMASATSRNNSHT
jgi:hypothetical protein